MRPRSQRLILFSLDAERTVILFVSLIIALLCTAAAHLAYATVTRIWLDHVHFFNYYWPLAHLLCAGFVLGVAVLIFLRTRDVGALLFLVGMIGVLGVIFYYCFVTWGMAYHWFRGFGPFPPHEYPVVAFILNIFEAVCLLAYIGIFWMSLQFAREHLTMRWSQRRPT